jgi:hypothetical protein
MSGVTACEQWRESQYRRQPNRSACAFESDFEILATGLERAQITNASPHAFPHNRCNRPPYCCPDGRA